MSSYLVGATHIDALLTAGLFAYDVDDVGGLFWRDSSSVHTLSPDNASAVGAMLLAANQQSVNYQYGDCDAAPSYRFSPLPGTPDPHTILNAIRCFRYQSCECPEWDSSEAARFVSALQDKMIAQVCLENETWEIDDRNVFRSPKADQALHL